MKICVLGSGSSGNSLLIWTNRSKILIDAGLSLRQIRGRLERVDVAIQDIEALFITHEHTDHIRSSATLARRLGIPVFLTEGTCAACNSTFEDLPAREIFTPGDIICFKDLQIVSYSVSHDAADPVNFLFCHKNRKVGMAMDLGYPSRLVKERLRQCDALILETNHNREMLMNGGYPWQLKQRIMSRRGHLSNEQSASVLYEVAHQELRAVFLAHLSQENNHPQLVHSLFKCVLEETGLNHVPLFVASQDEPTEVFEIP
ncbi:MAG: MBL fold metallo-hydrolase [Candidatus Hydrogenedentes bacterium]|nr:MBL fold metallo-hydrolase [Candidatus Hydrogenedentota bacterium]